MHAIGLLAVGALLLAAAPAAAQQITGTLGSPSATVTPYGQVLPPSAMPFGGEINLNASQSKPWWPPRAAPPKVAAAKYQVLPLDASVATRVVAPRPSLTAGRTEFTYSGEMTGTPNGDAPSILNASYTITAEVEIPQGGAEGMLVTQGGRFAGYGFYLLKNKPVFLYNLFDVQRVRWEGSQALSPGKHVLVFDFKYDGLGIGTLAFNNPSGIGRGGTGVLKVDGKTVATQRMEHTIPLIMKFDENFDVGADTGTPVNDRDYQVPFEFTGKLTKLTLAIDRPKLSAEDERKLVDAERQATDHPAATGSTTPSPRKP